MFKGREPGSGVIEPSRFFVTLGMVVHEVKEELFDLGHESYRCASQYQFIAARVVCARNLENTMGPRRF
jgi:hypothetical protein